MEEHSPSKAAAARSSKLTFCTLVACWVRTTGQCVPQRVFGRQPDSQLFGRQQVCELELLKHRQHLVGYNFLNMPVSKTTSTLGTLNMQDIAYMHTLLTWHRLLKHARPCSVQYVFLMPLSEKALKPVRVAVGTTKSGTDVMPLGCR